MTIFVYFGVISIIIRVNPKAGPPGDRSGWRQRWISLSKVWGVIALFILIMGGIFLGVFTPSEAGGIGAVGALAFAVGRRKMSWWAFFASLGSREYEVAKADDGQSENGSLQFAARQDIQMPGGEDS